MSDGMEKARRKKGEGTLRDLGGGKYLLELKVQGKRRARVFYARNDTELRAKSDTIRVALRDDFKTQKTAKHAKRSERQAWTVAQYIEYYFQKHAPNNLAATTRQRYRGIADRQIIPNIGKLRMSEVTPSDLQDMYAALASEGARARGGGGLSGPTIWTVHSVVRSVYTFATEIETDFETNPAKGKAARPKADKTTRKARALDVAEVERFVDLMREESPDFGVPTMLSARLGTRRGETLGIRWADVDFKHGTVTIQRSVAQTRAEGVIVKSTKTGKDRTIPLDTCTLSELRVIQREQIERRLKLGRGWQGARSPEDDYLSTTPAGAVIEPEKFGQAFRTVAERNKLEHITPHILRHSWVSQMIALGFDAVTIAAMSGHSPDVLLTTYAHAFDARKREAIDALGKAREQARAAK